MEWEGILFFVGLALFLLLGKYAVEQLAEVIIKKHGRSMVNFLKKHSSSPIVKFIFKTSDQKETKVDNQENRSDENEPVTPRILVKPVCDPNTDKNKSDNTQDSKPS